MTNIVITMAGLGSRFRKAGFDMPKYEIEANGRTLFEWSILSLRHFFQSDYKLIFLTLKENQSEPFIRDHCNRLGLSEPVVLELDQLTDGQATTALVAKIEWVPSDPLIIYNIDTLVRPSVFQDNSIPEGSDGWVPCFKAIGDHWSFIEIGPDGWAVNAAEKRRISPNATIGLYWFRSASLFENLYEKHFLDGEADDGVPERYIAPMYKTLINQNGKVSISDLPVDAVTGLGTPDELKNFIASSEKYQNAQYMELT